MNTIKYMIPAMVALVLASCKVSKDIPVPDAELPANYRSIAAADSNSIATLQWKEFLPQQELQQLIDSAIARNYDLQLALQNINAAQLLVNQSRLGYLPTAGLQFSGGINRPSDNSLNGLSLSQFLGKSYVEDYTAAVNVSWEADIWGKIRNQKSRALASYLQTNEAKKAIQTSLVASIAKGYYNLLMLDAQVAIARKNLLLNDSTLNIIKLQYQAGQVTSLAIQQAEGQRLVAAQLIPRLQKEISLQENALSVLTGKNPAEIRRAVSINDLTTPQIPAVGYPASLLQNRPDVHLKELQLTIANANVGITKANMYPTLAISATTGLNAFKASNWFSVPASLFGVASGSIAQPLFQRAQLKTNFELAKIDREKTVIQFRQSVLTALGEVSDALARVSKLQEEYEISARRSAILQQATINADQLFKNGMANYLEVITAQSNVLAGELELAVIKQQQLSATVELYTALGGGWR